MESGCRPNGINGRLTKRILKKENSEWYNCKVGGGGSCHF